MSPQGTVLIPATSASNSALNAVSVSSAAESVTSKKGRIKPMTSTNNNDALNSSAALNVLSSKSATRIPLQRNKKKKTEGQKTVSKV